MPASSSAKETLSYSALESEIERASKQRPSFSIRARITLGFLLWFLLSLAITVVWLVLLNRIQSKLLFMESAGEYTFEIQQARRFEKNYFLYGTNLDDALEHVHQAQEILAANADQMAAVVGQLHFETMVQHVRRYEELMTGLQAMEKHRADGTLPPKNVVENELRTHGAEMVAVADELLAKERKAVNTMLLMSQRVPIGFLVVLLLLMIYLASFVARQMLQPLNRLMEATRRIAIGDFTPMPPRRKYRDEFSELVMAMNHMMLQLVQRQELLVQSHKLHAVGTLTAGVAHELNNPINNIMLTSAMLLEDYKDLPDEERREMINELMEQSERAQKIVRNLLDFARESELKTQLLEVKRLLSETVQLAGNQIKLAKVKVQFECPSNLPPIHGDSQQLTQVFLNLVLNALAAMPKGGTLSIKASSAVQKGDYVQIQVIDTGAGVPEHVLPKIFDPFFTSKPAGKGTGLGLSVSLGIIRKHGGDIQVSTQVGKGATFSVLLPVARIPASIPEQATG